MSNSKITETLGRMMLWYRIAWGGMIFLILCSVLATWWPVLQVISVIILAAHLASVGVVLFFMYKSASCAATRWWALKQVILAILLMPLFGIGWMVMPIVVKSNLNEWGFE